MKRGFLSQYFTGVAIKRLTPVESNPNKSNQHEFNGVKELKKLLGKERLSNKPVRFVWLGEINEGVSEDSSVTWYDSRENHPTRSEFRLYFKSNPVMELATTGDLLIVAKRPSGDLMIIISSEGCTIENQLLWLFGVNEDVANLFKYKDIDDNQDTEVDYVVRFILDEIGVDIEEPDSERLDGLLERFKGKFPSTAIFSEFARDTISVIDPKDDADQAILTWMDHEELLFRRLERHIVSERLKSGFSDKDGADVEGFIKFSLSVQNRRKSRMGLAFENHLQEIFKQHNLMFSRTAITENKSKPDFLFPGEKAYHDRDFPPSKLTMLGVKSTCKDRWRQVLTEAERISNKHLITLEPGISQNQTMEMAVNNLQLVIPKKLHKTYNKLQQEWLLDLGSFIQTVKEREKS